MFQVNNTCSSDADCEIQPIAGFCMYNDDCKDLDLGICVKKGTSVHQQCGNACMTGANWEEFLKYQCKCINNRCQMIENKSMICERLCKKAIRNNCSWGKSYLQKYNCNCCLDSD